MMPKGVAADPDVKARILALAQSGVRPALIHRQLAGVRITFVYGVIAAARARGVALPTFPRERLTPQENKGHVARVCVWQAEQVARLEAASRARRCSPSEIIRRIVETVRAEGMVDAVLDDR